MENGDCPLMLEFGNRRHFGPLGNLLPKKKKERNNDKLESTLFDNDDV